MDRVIESFKKYYGWILAVGVIGIVFGGFFALMMLINAVFTSALGGSNLFGLIGIIGLVFVAGLIIFPSVLLLKFCSNVRQARLNGSGENIEQACRYQAIYIIFTGVILLIMVMFMLFGLMMSGFSFGFMSMGMGM